MPEAPMPSRAAEPWLALAIYAVATALLYATSPTGLDFWWQDAPRHALDGVFVRDQLAAMPLHDPAGWAMQYYVQYPALTILFYPPSFYLIEAGFFAVFGVSHAVAQLAETPHALVLAMASFGVARRMLPLWSALAVGLLAVGVPITAFWTRQVMLDVPAYATLMAGLWFMLRFWTQDRTRDLLFACLFLVAAVYTKQTVVFILPAIAVGLVVTRGWKALLERRLVLATLASLVALGPMAFLTWKFGAVNVQSVGGRAGDASRLGLAAWTFYARLLPEQLGWPVLLLGIIGLCVLIWRGTGPRWATALLLTWVIFGYLFFSAIGVREPRHDMMVLFPLVIGAVLALHAVLRPVAAQASAALLAVATFATSLILVPAPMVSGYAAIAARIAEIAPKDAVVLYSGYRDGTLIFALRSERPDITTVRADKLLLNIAVERERGVGQTDDSEADIAARIHDLGASLVVVQLGFWSDLREMRRLEHVLAGPGFATVGDFPVTGTLSTNDGPLPSTVRILRPTTPVVAAPDRARLLIHTLGGQVGGSLAK